MQRAKKLKVPKEIYVTAKSVLYGYYDGLEWVLDEEYLFAFLHPHEPNTKSDAKRKATQLKWAYGYYETIDDVVHSEEWDIQRLARNKKPAKFQPQVLSNAPLTGFEIFKVNTRYSTSNKLFLVKDPRGFVTEITASSLLGILLDGTISNGVIKDACVWQANKNLIVYKEP